MHDLRLAKYLTYQHLTHLEDRMERHGHDIGQQLSWRNLSFETGEWISRQTVRLKASSTNGESLPSVEADSSEGAGWLQRLLPFLAGAATAALRVMYEQSQPTEAVGEEEAEPVPST